MEQSISNEKGLKTHQVIPIIKFKAWFMQQQK